MELPSGYDTCCFELEMKAFGLGMNVDFPWFLLFCLHCAQIYGPKKKKKHTVQQNMINVVTAHADPRWTSRWVPKGLPHWPEFWNKEIVFFEMWRARL